MIGAGSSKEDEVNNPFLGMPAGAQTSSALSLSVYCKPLSLARPKTAKIHIGAWGPMPYDPNAPAAEGEEAPPQAPPEVPPEEEPGRFPIFQNTDNMQLVARTATEQARLETMQEIVQIKNKLAKEGVPMSMTVLQKAMMIPEDIERRPFEKKYPDPVEGLMVNPFPKAKKKKGKKGKKKR